MAGPRSYKPQTGVRFPQLRPADFHSPIGGREPAFEAGDVGSIPARGAEHGGRGVLACTPRCERGGEGSIPFGHPINWVWVNGWPPGPEPGPRRFDSCRPDGSRTQARPRRWPRDGPAPGPVDDAECRRPLKAQDRVRLPAGSRRPIGLRGNGCRTFNPENGVRLPDGTQIESAAEWSATGPENRGGGDEPQRFDSSTLVHT